MNRQLLRTSEMISLDTKAYQYTYSSGMSVHLKFIENKAHWEIVSGKNKGEKGINQYLAREIDQGIYLVQWYEPDYNATITLVINEEKGSISSSEAYEGERVFDTAVIHNLSI